MEHIVKKITQLKWPKYEKQSYQNEISQTYNSETIENWATSCINSRTLNFSENRSLGFNLSNYKVLVKNISL